MTELTGYFDGTVCIPYFVENLKPQQKVKIIVLDEFVPQKRDLKRFVGQISISDAEVMKKNGKLLDTNIIIRYIRGDSSLDKVFEEEELYVSTVTIGEDRRG